MEHMNMKNMGKDKTVVFRVDAGKIIGTGHLSRCLNLAEILYKNNYKIIFIGKDLPSNLISNTNKNFFHFVQNYQNDQPITDNTSTWLGRNFNKDATEFITLIQKFFNLNINSNINLIKFDLLVVDHYAIDHQWESQMKFFFHKILVIDDLANRKHWCHYLLDATPYENGNNPYKTNNLIPNFCKTLIGPKYILLNQLYHEKNKKNKNHQLPYKLLITFGGSDFRNLTEKILECLLDYKIHNYFNEIHIICGHLLDVERLHKINNLINNLNNYNNNLNIKLHQGLSQTQMIDLYLHCDLCIGTCGFSSFERCCLGLPSLAITVADNQTQIAYNLNKLKCIRYIGNWDQINEKDIQKAIIQFIENKELLLTIKQNGMVLVDGLGTSRVFDIIK